MEWEAFWSLDCNEIWGFSWKRAIWGPVASLSSQLNLLNWTIARIGVTLRGLQEVFQDLTLALGTLWNAITYLRQCVLVMCQTTSIKPKPSLYSPSRQHSYLRRCWSGGESFATLCKIWPTFGVRILGPSAHQARALTTHSILYNPFCLWNSHSFVG